MPVAGRRRGTIRGTAGTIPGITIHGGTGTIRSTIPLGMAGAIRTIIPHGIRPVTTVITIMVAATSVVAEAVACRRTCVSMTVATTLRTAVGVTARV